MSVIQTAQSNIKPDKVWVRPLDDGSGKAIVTLRRNIKEVEPEVESSNDEEQDITETYYEYEEASVLLVNRKDLEKYAKNNINELFDLAEQEASEATIPSQVDVLTQIVTSLMLEVDALKADKGVE